MKWRFAVGCVMVVVWGGGSVSIAHSVELWDMIR